jgi:hypothetical protein
MKHQKSMTDAVEQALNSAQGVFSANPAFLAPQTKQFLHVQEQMFSEIEKYSESWFQRRQVGVRHLLETGRRIAADGPANPAAALKELADWQTGAMRRLGEDAQDCNAMMSRCASSIVSHEVEAIEETTDTMRKATASSNAVAV